MSPHGIVYFQICLSATLSSQKKKSDTIFRRSGVDQEDLKPYWKSENRPHFSRRLRSLLF